MKQSIISFLLCMLFTCISSAQVIPEGTYCIKIARDTGFCMDLSENGKIANGQNILLWGYWGGNGQKWIVTHDRGAIIIRSYVNRNYVVSLRNGIAKNDENVWLWEYNGSDGQRWYPKYEDGHYILQSAQNPHYNIDLYCGNIRAGENIQCYENNGFYAQHWIFERVDDSNSSNSSSHKPEFHSIVCPICGGGGTIPYRNYATCPSCGGVGVLTSYQ